MSWRESMRRTQCVLFLLGIVSIREIVGFSRVVGVDKGSSIVSRSSSVLGFVSVKERKGDHGSFSRREMASSSEVPDEVDVVVVGSGIGGLSAAAMCSLYGYSVAVLESHSVAGGCAHGYTVRDKDGNTYQFDTGPSFFSGLGDYAATSSAAVNPLRTVLDAIDEQLECEPYTTFGLSFPEGRFLHTSNYTQLLEQWYQQQEGSNNNKAQELQSWERLMELMKPLAKTVEAMPTAALRTDAGVALTTAPFLPQLMSSGQPPWKNLELTQPFQSLLEKAGVNRKTQQWLDVLCFCLSGLPASGTITAEMAMMMGEFYAPHAIMDCPIGGAKAIVDALVRGIEKRDSCNVFTNTHVQQIHTSAKNQPSTVTYQYKKQTPKTINAKVAVISNLSVWDLFGSGIIKDDTSSLSQSYIKERMSTPVGKSFMHLHVGFRATPEELSKLQAHYIHVQDWSMPIDAPDNLALLSIPSVHDHTLAPPGYAVLHIYTPATEDYHIWKPYENDTKSKEYKQLKEQRSQHLWKVLETIIPDIRSRATITQVGTPLTHKRFLRRHKGSYGPAIVTGKDKPFPFPSTPIPKLFMCGDSLFPGIGVPAVAGSGIIAANSISFDSLQPQLKMLEEFRQRNSK